ncbi:iron chelate uptake ABC transporter family permease subunit [Allokutzneria multivorans]|uniref:Iron chelate uptake ABC transporter family permease subunit n=1 Tax=Allokutzneria multivorans TaxID=1142134 RepID=A0ABP7R9F8_9PSEU
MSALMGRETSIPGRPALRVGPVSWMVRLRPVLVPVIAFGLLALAMAVNLGRGDFPIGVGDVLAVLLGGGDDTHAYIVLELRLPRALTGALVGAALALAGAITQSIARNPLASPDILGVTAGAGVGAVAVIMLGGSAGGISGGIAELGLPAAALGGGLVAALFVFAISWQRGIDGYRLVLVGLGITAVLVAIKFYLLTLSEVADAGRAMVWITGSLNGRGWEHVTPVALALLVLVPLALFTARPLGGLQFGDDTARGLGIRVNGSRAALILIAVGLAATATASAGPVEFVALATPQIAMRMAGTPQPPLVGSMVLGAALTVIADVIARTAFGVVELPVGIVTAVIGAPYLMYLLVRRYREVRT